MCYSIPINIAAYFHSVSWCVLAILNSKQKRTILCSKAWFSNEIRYDGGMIACVPPLIFWQSPIKNKMTEE